MALADVFNDPQKLETASRFLLNFGQGLTQANSRGLSPFASLAVGFGSGGQGINQLRSERQQAELQELQRRGLEQQLEAAQRAQEQQAQTQRVSDQIGRTLAGTSNATLSPAARAAAGSGGTFSGPKGVVGPTTPFDITDPASRTKLAGQVARLPGGQGIDAAVSLATPPKATTPNTKLQKLAADRVAGLLTQKEFETQRRRILTGAKSPAQLEQDLAVAQARAGGVQLTKGQEAVDKAFADEVYVPFVTGGGFADAEKNLAQIEGAIKAFESGENLTGNTLSFLPNDVRAVFDREGLSVQQQIEEVVQRNLREVLGAQFTEREGERLISRAFDPRLDESENLTRLRRLFGAMKTGLKAKVKAAEYFEENGTLKGFKGARGVTVDDLDEAIGPKLKGESEVTGEPAQFEGMSFDELQAVDVESLSVEELEAYLDRLSKGPQ